MVLRRAHMPLACVDEGYLATLPRLHYVTDMDK